MAATDILTYYKLSNAGCNDSEKINTDLEDICEAYGNGTVGTIPKWSATNTLTDSLITESGTEITVGGSLKVDTIDALGSAATVFLTHDSNVVKSRTAAQVADDIEGDIDHGNLAGLADDDHAQYLLLAGRSGGQTAYGDTAARGNLTLYGTSHATAGIVRTYAYHRVLNDSTTGAKFGLFDGDGYESFDITMPDSGSSAVTVALDYNLVYTMKALYMENQGTSPSWRLHNTIGEDTEGGREGTIVWRGEQSGGEETTLAWIRGSHDGASDDEKGKVEIYTNDGSDGNSPTKVLTIDSDGNGYFVGYVGIGDSASTTYRVYALEGSGKDARMLLKSTGTTRHAQFLLQGQGGGVGLTLSANRDSADGNYRANAAAINVTTNHPLDFMTNNTRRMTISSAGTITSILGDSAGTNKFIIEESGNGDLFVVDSMGRTAITDAGAAVGSNTQLKVTAPDAQSTVICAIGGYTLSDGTNNYGVQGTATGGSATNNYGVYANAANASSNNYHFVDGASNYSTSAGGGSWVDASCTMDKKATAVLLGEDEIAALESVVKALKPRRMTAENDPSEKEFVACALDEGVPETAVYRNSDGDINGYSGAKLAMHNLIILKDLIERIERLEAA